MANRIRAVEIRERLVDLMEPEVWVTVHPEQVTATTEVVGRLVGPRCRFAGTVEVAYPLRPFARGPLAFRETPSLPRRVVIPEASYWDTESPFLYVGPVELWEEGRPCDRTELRVGLRVIQLGPRGVSVNGRPTALRGAAVRELTEGQALALREQGINLLIAPASPATAGVWDLADQIGFLVLGRVRPSPDSLRAAEARRGHPSRLGWLLELSAANAAQVPEDLRTLAAGHPGALLGVELRDPALAVPDNAHFILCPAGALSRDAAPLTKPLLVEAENGSFVAGPGVLGWVRR
jgi:hypothetical protein